MKTQDIEFTQHFTDTTFGNCYPGKIARDVPADKAKKLIANGLAQDPTDEDADEGYEALTVKELKAELDAREIEYARENKGGLIALLEADDADESGDDKEYSDMTIEELQAEMTEREIEFSDDDTVEDLAAQLTLDDKLKGDLSELSLDELKELAGQLDIELADDADEAAYVAAIQEETE